MKKKKDETITPDNLLTRKKAKNRELTEQLKPKTKTNKLEKPQWKKK